MHPLLEELVNDVIRGSVVESPYAASFDGEEYKGWYCINHKPLFCLNCGETVCYAEPVHYHMIIVWEEKDDRYMLRIAAKLKGLGIDPRIDTYHPYLGPCIPWEEVTKLDEHS